MKEDGRQIRVLVVDDSAVARELLTHILSSDPEITVVATAADGAAALEATKLYRPDVITMDIVMPGLDGFAATRQIMETQPTPIVIVTANANPEDVATSFKAMEAGALSVLFRPAGINHLKSETTAQELTQTVKLMSEVKVLRRWPHRPRAAAEQAPGVSSDGPAIDVLAIGASTGGPVVLQRILSGLPLDFPAPVLIVQHIAAGFVEGLAAWLETASGFPAKVAADGEQLLPGRAYLAPDGYHVGLTPGNRVALSLAPLENGLRPSVSYLFRCVAAAFGRRAAAVLLTGMGRDGAAELKLLKDAGAVTFAQDGSTSVVHGMPGEAIRLDAATYVLPPEQIASTIARLAGRGAGRITSARRG